MKIKPMRGAAGHILIPTPSDLPLHDIASLLFRGGLQLGDLYHGWIDHNIGTWHFKRRGRGTIPAAVVVIGDLIVLR